MRGKSTLWVQLLRLRRVIILTATATAVSPLILSVVFESRRGGADEVRWRRTHADLAETARLLEGMGIKTASSGDRSRSGPEVGVGIAIQFSKVNAIVCIGGNSTTWEAPRLERVIAASPEMVERLRGPFELEAMSVIGVSINRGYRG